jgi:hypothetical protein
MWTLAMTRSFQTAMFLDGAVEQDRQTREHETAMTVTNVDIEKCMLELLGRRVTTASICPSDVARALVRDEDGWRALMPSIGQVAARLAHEERIVMTQKGTRLNPESSIHGPIRLRRGPKFIAPE